ncbi:MarR family transcriptional regulator [Escherichia coli]|uniref:MarR family transcriptional regulator n=1 Tax=Escherichia coli TaxID=562 RepID=UPI0013029A4A|nr:MarR family transcriptional regulator [Escherichia coli]KAE9821797.1 MarR family transcriptional regulator [Escherichia coli]MDS1689750.1 MarR family transcriptional regulator [Escherichia coli]MWK18069.1 MarR family transcriptional regulator [Escherichia coli]MWK86126.1 MarR family transcriptional regulator [Escherichia coli]MWL97011.1 MarR family transcriptional regulator [Escherichia coli]
MDDIKFLEKIIRYQQNKNPLYPFQEHLLMQLCIRVNKKIQDDIVRRVSRYGINYSMYMVLIILLIENNHCLSPSEICKKLQFSRTNSTYITDSLEKAGYIEKTDDREDRRGKKILLTSSGMFFIKKITLEQGIYLKIIWGSLSCDECELFENFNKKLLMHFADVW